MNSKNSDGRQEGAIEPQHDFIGAHEAYIVAHVTSGTNALDKERHDVSWALGAAGASLGAAAPLALGASASALPVLLAGVGALLGFLISKQIQATNVTSHTIELLPVHQEGSERAADRLLGGLQVQDSSQESRPEPRTVIAERTRAPERVQRPARERQASLALGDAYQLPPLDLLAPPPPQINAALDKASLERNARLLESVLEDFSVKGEIVEVRPGPVVTMYELEPASGIKASRVIQLADDIARNMSSLSARVATVPGRSVIGIELPNPKREMVVLSELIASHAFEDQVAQLPIVLGKNIAGDPVVADLAPMPHLLVAGTTGSGKSVGLNCMILSLLYRLTPEQCKMILIDPKMLELSTYDDIPHLLAPVVTEPAKAIRALKWTVEQMEERYRMMASVGVRQLSSFNAKIREAKAKGQTLGRRVQTGYDPETGQPKYEMEELEYEVLPQIVVVVDELADLMMTAGKEVEFLIQRLAQKARAAGIHLIMATQRPSVDVITGVIKANLPTRISFAVTSKIDSRTILGEQGAEQLLGKGDMLYMPGGKQIARVHGPFVSDEEVRAVAEFWKAQGRPEYVQAVTEEPEDGGYMFEGQPTGEDDPEAQLYRKAVQTVAESQKASTSYLQRQLRVGYNNAARLIERMEKDGVVSAPDHVGRREVLVDPEGRPI
jgi:S-DNA-T family DNA segregation ATPase FtsK/SpoIIIE